jgi:hypothetical protein
LYTHLKPRMFFHSTVRKELARSFGGLLVVLVTIVMTMTLIRTLSLVSRGILNAEEVTMVMGYTVLGYLPTILALSLFIAIVGTLSRMYRDRFNHSPLAESPAKFAALLCGVFMAALLFRSSSLLLNARMWGEEGSFYYATLQDMSGTSAWTLVVRGNYQLLMNMTAALAVRAPAAWAAYVTTGVALAVALVMVALIGRLAEERSWGVWPTCLAVVAAALLPQGYEIYLTTTNVQWLLSVSVLLLALLRLSEWPRWQKNLALAWTALCAVSGVPPVTLAPVVLFRGVADRSRVHLAMAALLTMGAMIQLAVILTHAHEGRAFALDPFITIVGFLVQAVVSPLFGVDPTEHYLTIMRSPEAPWWLLFGLIAFAIGVAWLALRAVIAAPGGRRLALTLVAAAVLTAVVNVLGSIGPQDHLVSSWRGGRYFILSAICWLLMLCAAASDSRKVVRLVAGTCLLLSVVSGAMETGSVGWNRFLLNGPSWSATVSACGGRRPCDVQVWPGGADWTFPLTRP